MLKRLVIGVLTMSFMLMIGATVYADKPGHVKAEQEPWVNPTAPLYGMDRPSPRANPGLTRIPVEAAVPSVTTSKGSVPSFACVDQDNTDYATAFAALSVFSGGSSSGAVLGVGNTAFVTPGFVCSLDGTWWYFDIAQGNHDVRFSIWTGAGGIPTTEVAFQVLNRATTPLVVGWNYIDWSTFSLNMTSDFFYTLNGVAGTGTNPGFGAANDRVRTNMDNNDGLATTTRSGVLNYPAGGGWQANTLYAGGFHRNSVASAVVCCKEIPYTNCTTDGDADQLYYLYKLPSNASCRSGIAHRFRGSGGEDTINNVYIYTYQLSGPEPGAKVTISLLKDDGAGVPVNGPAGVLATVDVGGPGFETDLYPGSGYITWSPNYILPAGTTDFHVAMYWSGPNPETNGVFILSDCDDCGPPEGHPDAKASVFFPGTYQPVDPTCTPAFDGWFNFNAVFGYLTDFAYFIDRCRDEASVCELLKNWVDPSLNFGTSWCAEDGYLEFAGIFPKGGEECRIESASIGYRRYRDLSGLTVKIYNDAGGIPGTLVYSEFVPVGSFPTAPNTNANGKITVYPNGGAGVVVTGVYWVSGEPGFNFAAPPCAGSPSLTSGSYFRTLLDDASGVDNSAAFVTGPGWVRVSDPTYLYGGPRNFRLESFQCCVPFNERVCAPADEWPTFAHNYARDDASLAGLGDADCNLNHKWTFTHTAAANFTGPTIANGKVYAAHDIGIDCIDLATGLLVWDELTDATVAPMYTNISGVRVGVTVANVTGSANPVAFLGTGTGRDLIAVNANTGAYMWHSTTGLPFAGLYPNTVYVKALTLEQGGATVVYVAAEGKLYAYNALTGTAFGGWATNPITFPSATTNANAISTDGTQIFANTLPGATAAGNLWSYNAATGATLWDLATTVGNPGLRAAVDGLSLNGFEGFLCAPAYDAIEDVVWSNSIFSTQSASAPKQGFLYRIAADGSAYTATTASAAARTSVTIDQNAVYVNGTAQTWVPAYDGAGIFDRNSGALLSDLNGDIFVPYLTSASNAVLSCESGVDDWFIYGTTFDLLDFNKVGLVNEWKFYRANSLSGANADFSGGAMISGTLAWQIRGGKTIVLTSGADRPRLSLLTLAASQVVPFFSPNGLPVFFDSIFTNTGCTDLLVEGITFDDVSSPPSITGDDNFSAMSSKLNKRMSEVASMQTNADAFDRFSVKVFPVGYTMEDDENATVTPSVETSAPLYRGAALPAVVSTIGGDGAGLIAPSVGTLIAPGQVAGITVSINGPNVTRGPHPIYTTICTNDPDYFLDDTARCPEVTLQVVGGCVEESTTIAFGVAGANKVVVWNNALEQRNQNDGPPTPFINSNGFVGASPAGFFAGFRFWSLSPARQAFTGDALSNLAGDDFWEGILGDPNYCTNTCKPGIQTNILLGEVSTDLGATYASVFGNVVASSYIDSLHDYGSPWSFQNVAGGFNNDSTMGIIVNETWYGALNQTAYNLDDFTLTRIDVNNRNATNLGKVYHGAYNDLDLNAFGGGGAGTHKVVGNTNYNYGYTYEPAAAVTVARGYAVIPFGCGIVSDFRARACDGPIWMYVGASCWDSTFKWLSGGAYAGITAQANMGVLQGGGGDMELFAGFGGYTLGPNGSATLGLVNFAFNGLANDADANQFIGLATSANKWAGFGRGDVNNDNSIDLADIIHLGGTASGGNGSYPYPWLSDVDNNGSVNLADANYLINYYFGCGPCPVSAWRLALCTP